MCILNLLKISFKHFRIHKSVSFSGSLSALFFFVSILKKNLGLNIILFVLGGVINMRQIKKNIFAVRHNVTLGLSH